MKTKYPIGSISHCTMHPGHLIPRFMGTLNELNDTWYAAAPLGREQSATEYSRIRDNLSKIEQRRASFPSHDDYYASEDADYDLELLFDELNNFAPPYFYFGAHPGDGSDYGFWLSEDWELEFDGLKVSDLAEVPGDYSGEVMLINDHGNMSLYTADNGATNEIWAIV